MAEEASRDPKEVFVTPVILTLKAVGLFFDVATLMVRLLINTVVHDSPQGKTESAEGGIAR
jgi:hypothetical protein